MSETLPELRPHSCWPALPLQHALPACIWGVAPIPDMGSGPGPVRGAPHHTVQLKSPHCHVFLGGSLTSLPLSATWAWPGEALVQHGQGGAQSSSTPEAPHQGSSSAPGSQGGGSEKGTEGPTAVFLLWLRQAAALAEQVQGDFSKCRRDTKAVQPMPDLLGCCGQQKATWGVCRSSWGPLDSVCFLGVVGRGSGCCVRDSVKAPSLLALPGLPSRLIRGGCGRDLQCKAKCLHCQCPGPAASLLTRKAWSWLPTPAIFQEVLYFLGTSPGQLPWSPPRVGVGTWTSLLFAFSGGFPAQTPMSATQF